MIDCILLKYKLKKGVLSCSINFFLQNNSIGYYVEVCDQNGEEHGHKFL